MREVEERVEVSGEMREIVLWKGLDGDLTFKMIPNRGHQKQSEHFFGGEC